MTRSRSSTTRTAIAPNKMSGSATERKYVVDITGELPVILIDLNLTDSSLKRKYIYADRQILAQHDIEEDSPAYDNKYFYLNDRLGSVRLVIDDQSAVKNTYTYEPFGEMLATECTETIENPFKFTGQYFDAEIEEYYLRARQYNPQIARFTSRDPVGGTAERPPTLHRYLYCWNDPVNRIDPDGEVPLANQVNAILTGFILYNHALELGTYAAAEEKWDFFHLMETTIMYMPVGMTIASRMPIVWEYLVVGWGATTIIDNAGTISGMSVAESLLMDPAATYFYLTTMLAVELELGISRSDMEEFGQWHQMLWPTKW